MSSQPNLSCMESQGVMGMEASVWNLYFPAPVFTNVTNPTTLPAE